MRPCDCKSINDTKQFLIEQGIGFNNQSITVIPNSVVLEMGHTKIKIPMSRFKAFSKWYLEDQDEKEQKHAPDTKSPAADLSVI